MPSSARRATRKEVKDKAGTGYQTMMNDALKAYLAGSREEPITESVLRRIIREELA